MLCLANKQGHIFLMLNIKKRSCTFRAVVLLYRCPKGGQEILKGGFDMFDSREYLLNEIALFANSNEALYRDTFKPIIDDGGL